MRILIVEDDRKLAEFVARGLRAERFAVDLAGNGREGESYINSYAYDLLILDLMLPQMSGTVLLRRVRQSHSSIPVLVLTARDAIEDKVMHFEAGADDYLTKPFDFAELNRLTQLVRRDGHRIDLTAKEYALFEYLLCSPGRVFSRTMILNHVWDQSFEGVTNIVDVYVRYLRRKVDEPFAVKLIHTVRGVGYCVREAEPERPAALE